MTALRRTRMAGVVFAFLSWALVAPAAAQDRLFVLSSVVSPEVGTAGRFGEAIGLMPDELAWPLVGGGRYAVRNSDIVDRRTGRVLPMPLGVPVAYDPARPRVFLAVFEPVTGIASYAIDTGVLTLLAPISGLLSTITPAYYAADADLLFALERMPPPLGPVEYAVVRPSDAAVVRRLVLPERIAAVTPDGSRVFTGHFFSDIRAYDAITGQQVGGTVAAPTALRWIDALDALFVVGGDVALFDRDLRPLVRLPEVDGKCPTRLAVSPHTDTAYLIAGGGDFYGSVSEATMTAFDLTGRRAPRRASLTRSLGLGRGTACVWPFLTTAPGPPRHVAASVSGRDVTLTWQNVGGASAFVLEAGVAPGRTDATVPIGPDSRVTFSGVPPGTYYLRLRGVNEFGAGLWSSDLRVVVP